MIRLLPLGTCYASRLFSLGTRCLSTESPSASKVQKAIKQVDRSFGEPSQERALKLIFGQKKYQQFSKKEKEIVDRYQEEVLKVDGGVILPNTKVDLEQIKYERAFMKQNKRVTSIFDKLKN